MIITKNSPFTKEEIEKLKEQFDSYVKTVIDVEKEICSAGADRHFDSEQTLLQNGLLKVKSGITSLEEVLQVAYE